MLHPQQKKRSFLGSQNLRIEYVNQEVEANVLINLLILRYGHNVGSKMNEL